MNDKRPRPLGPGQVHPELQDLALYLRQRG